MHHINSTKNKSVYRNSRIVHYTEIKTGLYIYYLLTADNKLCIDHTTKFRDLILRLDLPLWLPSGYLFCFALAENKSLQIT